MSPGSFRPVSAETQFADEIRRRLAAGLWPERLPGIAALVRDCGVSRQTVEKAFRILERSGELKKGGGRGEMRPARATRPPSSGGTLVLYTLHPELHGSESLDVLRAAAATSPEPVTFLRLETGTSREHVLAHVSASEAGSVLLMHQPWGTGAAVMAQGRRAFVFGSDGPDSPAPRIAMRFESLVRQGVRCAFDAGHTRVCHPVWRRKPEIVADIRRWIAEEYARAGLRHSPEFDAPVVADDTAAGMDTCIRALFRHTPPSALVLQNLTQWMATIHPLSDLRVRVPEDVSIVMLSHVRELDASPLTYAHLRYPVPRLVAEFRKILRRTERGQAGGDIILEPIPVVGASLTPARTSGR